MVISVDVEEAFDKIPSTLKVLEAIGLEGAYLKIVKAIYSIHIINTILNRK